MPIKNISHRTQISVHVARVNTFLGRLIGLIGSRTPPQNTVLHFPSTSSIHTFGMHYPVDLIFLNGKNEVIKMLSALSPRKLTRKIKHSKSVLEAPAGMLSENDIKVGDTLDIVEDAVYRPDVENLRAILHLPINILKEIL